MAVIFLFNPSFLLACCSVQHTGFGHMAWRPIPKGSVSALRLGGPECQRSTRSRMQSREEASTMRSFATTATATCPVKKVDGCAVDHDDERPAWKEKPKSDLLGAIDSSARSGFASSPFSLDWTRLDRGDEVVVVVGARACALAAIPACLQ
ncbi:hypothetical protein BS50DRAFT_339654 [Corynespora cassiicola Philippines]|uniref:Uncharacterized protein n=1 Tax=Corynespora cassiicola Philippines TaxID=1448308 RepID=A0A2T2NV64_CORCC|nr:hypothetical protein BS50DRAFT_339654 [Corynespora cassiicola Philippines]